MVNPKTVQTIFFASPAHHAVTKAHSFVEQRGKQPQLVANYHALVVLAPTVPKMKPATHIHHVPRQRLFTVATPFTMPHLLVLIPVQPATTVTVLKGRLVTSTHLATTSPHLTTRTHHFFLFLWTHTFAVPILLMHQPSAIYPVPLEAQRNAQSVRHAMEIHHAVVATRLFVERLGMMRQVSAKILVHQD